ncbi:RNA polymerase sigma factor [Chitinophaga pinensis]|uniref:Sigma-70 family RNA polymerase sigma factor n=1 Tax=Chitinophaga pinensis TaxID=79329 RepID=A0A5C6LV96_9BACT|nr:sigma-70 family RNA polymerase sigma factor [Chitinophaga pinensis]TWW00644.1 sigma-70 family RNA polymerase sigma factor [Chitinophaga pinensis]
MHVLDGYSDEQLFALLQDDDEIAFSIIFSRYSRRLYVEAFSKLQDEDEGNDIVQEVFCWLWDKRRVLSTPKCLKAYLIQVARNKCVDLIRKKTSTRGKKQQYVWLVDTFTTTSPIETKELGRQLAIAIDNITPASRQAFEQSYLHKKSLKEIADQMDINVQSVKNHIHRALKVLRENLKHNLS